jgi:hypothetical protein
VDTEQLIDAWLAQGAPGRTSASLRLARRISGLAARLDPLVEAPVERALLGLSVPDFEPRDPMEQLLLAVAATDGGTLPSVEDCAALEVAHANGPGWVAAARMHASASPARVQRARAALAEMSLPYVFPGETHPLMVDILAAGERILPAIHVDWVRKLTGWITPLLIEDCRVQGLWFWPVLRFLEQRKLARPLAQLVQAPRMRGGGLGMAAAYCHRLGIPGEMLLSDGNEADSVLAALAIRSDAHATG